MRVLGYYKSWHSRRHYLAPKLTRTNFLYCVHFPTMLLIQAKAVEKLDTYLICLCSFAVGQTLPVAVSVNSANIYLRTIPYQIPSEQGSLDNHDCEQLLQLFPTIFVVLLAKLAGVYEKSPKRI